MSAQIPDPKTFETWEDAFQYPVPSVRGMEKKLRKTINDNGEKLRTLVGSSYRDLLGTAKTIVDADGQMHDVEDLLARVGRRSDSRILERIATNQSLLARSEREKNFSSHTSAAQLSLLHKCLGAVRNLLKQGASSLLVAKLLVIARNLHRTLTRQENGFEILSALAEKLGSSRQKLLRIIDRRFARTTDNDAGLVEDMTAFCLVTSSTATDVLRHFQHVRLQSISDLETGVMSPPGRLQNYLGTQRASRAVFPEMLNASLRAVAARPLLQDPTVLSLHELNLDILISWIADDVKNFTSNPRYSDLGPAPTKLMLDTWTEEALSSLSESTKTDVRVATDFVSLMEVRRRTLQMWLSAKRYTTSQRGTSMLNQLRSLFISRFTELVDDIFERALSGVNTAYDETLAGWERHALPPASLWALAKGPIDLSNAAIAFRDQVKDRRQNRDPGINSVVLAFEKSWSEIHSLQGVVKQMKETRWAEDYDDDDLDEDVRPANALSKEDPQRVQDSLTRSANLLAQKLEEHLATSSAGPTYICNSPTAPGLFILRTIRELGLRLPRHLQEVSPSAVHHFACRDIVSRLQGSLIDSVQSEIEADMARMLTRISSTAPRLAALWDGNPPLPVQVSPSTVKLLRALVTRMESFGADLWSRDVVDGLRGSLRALLAERVTMHLDADGESQNDATEQMKTEEGANVNGAKKKPEKKAKAEESEEMITEEADTPSIPQSNGAHQSPGEEKTQMEDSEASNTGETNGDETATPGSAESPTTTNGATNTSQATTEGRRQARAERLKLGYTQLLFDVLFLGSVFVSVSSSSAPTFPHPATASLQDATALLLQKTQLPEASAVKMRKSAAESWRRTYLLFGLLCA